MTAIVVSPAVRDRLAEIAARQARDTGQWPAFSDVIERLLEAREP